MNQQPLPRRSTSGQNYRRSTCSDGRPILICDQEMPKLIKEKEDALMCGAVGRDPMILPFDFRNRSLPLNVAPRAKMPDICSAQ